jgi:transcriptional regulator with XRE-family HTH domain
MKEEQPYKAVGLRLRKLRGNVPQKEFAVAVGLSERAYRRYELGERLPSFDILMRISAIGECSLSWLVGGGPDTLNIDDIKAWKNRLDSTIKKLKASASKDAPMLGNIVENYGRLRTKKDELMKRFGDSEIELHDQPIELLAPEAQEVLNYIFSFASQDVIQFVMDALDLASTFAFLGLDMDVKYLGKRVPRSQNEP